MDNQFTWLQREKRWMYATAIVLFLLSLVFASRAYFLQHVDREWNTLRVEVDAGESRLISRRLDQLVTEIREQSDRLMGAGTADLLVRKGGQRRHAAATAQMLQEFPEEDWSFELRDNTGALVAFSGEPMTSTPSLPPEAEYTILQRTPYVLLTRILPVTGADGTHLGSLRVGTPLTTIVPINDRFLNSEGFIPALSRELETDLEFHRSKLVAEPDTRLSLPFVAAGDTLGHVSFHAADREGYLGYIGRQFDRVLGFLLLCLLIIVSIPLLRIYRSITPAVAGFALALAHIWGIRYLLLLSDFAAIMFPASLLDPAYFASTFGGGITNAPGELLLSVLALLLFSMYGYRMALTGRDRPVRRVTAYVGALLVFLVLPFLLRAFAASLRSFVIDSGFNFDDVTGLFTQPMFMLMLVNTYLLSLALGFGLLGMYLFLKRIWQPDALGARRAMILAGGVAVSACSLLLLTNDTLLPLWTYALFLLAFIVPQLVRVPPIRGRSASFFAPFAVTVVIGGILTVGVFGHFMEAKRFSEIEAIAIDLSRPVDGWSQVLLEQTLQYVSHANIEDIPSPLRQGQLDYEAAFRIWSGSPLSRLQNNSAILLLDSARNPVSRFAVGNDPFLLSMHTLSTTVERTEGIVQSTYRWQETRGRRYYKAYTDVTSTKYGTLLAVIILETLDPMQITRQSVDLLRSGSAQRSLAPEDEYIISRFHNGRMVQTTDRRLERSFGLPRAVRSAIASGTQVLWDTLPVDGTQLESYFMVVPDTPSDVLSITRGKSVFILSVYRGLRILVLYLAFSAIILLVVSLTTGRRRAFTRFTFARKLQLALLAVAAIPLLFVWISGRSFIMENTRRDIEQQVADDLDVLRTNILDQLPDTLEVTDVAGYVDDIVCQEIHLRSGRDLNVYAGADLVATSKPELYHVGLLNTRLHPLAYVNIVQLGKDAYFVSERIGDFAYHVGYRAMRDTDGNLVAVLSTPTLFQQEQVEMGYVRASATIFFFITIISVLVVLISTALARQISRPLKELLFATRDISAGNLNRQLSVRGSAEIVDLMDSFNTMTVRLRQSQEELAAAERELAWKEMAKQVAHEIRNPLTPMKLAVQHLHKAWRDGAEQLGEIIEKVTRTLIDQIDSLSRISDEFSRFGRMPRRSTSAVDIAATLTEAVSLFRSHQDVVFDLAIAANLPRVLADREELARAITNILRNAVQAMHDQGRIEIRAEGRDDLVVLCFTDSGIGIASELLPRIFEPNFSTKTEGMGLGLAIVKKIIDDAGGLIRIESAEGEGTSVIIELPAAQ